MAKRLLSLFLMSRLLGADKGTLLLSSLAFGSILFMTSKSLMAIGVIVAPVLAVAFVHWRLHNDHTTNYRVSPGGVVNSTVIRKRHVNIVRDISTAAIIGCISLGLILVI